MTRKTYIVTCQYSKARWKNKRKVPVSDSLNYWRGEVLGVHYMENGELVSNLRIATEKAIQASLLSHSEVIIVNMRYGENS